MKDLSAGAAGGGRTSGRNSGRVQLFIRRMGRIGVVLVIAVVTAAAALPAAARDRAPANVRISACEPGGDASTRSARFQTTTLAIPGTARMQVRLTLLERLGEGVFEKVSAPGLEVWRTSREGARRFVYTQEIAGLKPNAAYRVAVRYRWRNADGEVIRTARRRSDVCEVEGSLPDLRVVRISARRDAAGTANYSVIVRNAGGADARNVDVRLTVDGSPLSASTLGSLIALETRPVRFSGPACTRTVSAVIDPADALRESGEEDNVLSIPCPLR